MIVVLILLFVCLYFFAKNSFCVYENVLKRCSCCLSIVQRGRFVYITDAFWINSKEKLRIEFPLKLLKNFSSATVLKMDKCRKLIEITCFFFKKKKNLFKKNHQLKINYNENEIELLKNKTETVFTRNKMVCLSSTQQNLILFRTVIYKYFRM